MLQFIESFRKRGAPKMQPSPPPEHSRTKSLPQMQTLSPEGASPPGSNLEQIHASSSQTPGLTSFSLASPPASNTEQLSFNRIYSRVKSFAGAMRDVVGVPGSASSSPTKSVLSGRFGSDEYYQQSASRDSFVTTATMSDDGQSLSSPSRGHLNQQLLSSMQSLSSSRVSVSNSVASFAMDGEYAPPAALRKVSIITASPSVAPVTVFRDGSEAILDGAPFASTSRTSSTANLQKAVATKKNMGPLKPTVGSFVEAVGNVVGATAGFAAAATGKAILQDAQKSLSVRDDDFEDSGSEDTLSGSSDDDAVLLHSKLPVGTVRGRLKPDGISDRNGKVVDVLKKKTRPSTPPKSPSKQDTTLKFAERKHLQTPVVGSSEAVPNSKLFASNAPAPALSLVSPKPSIKADSNLPQLSALNLQSTTTNRINHPPPPTAPSSSHYLRQSVMQGKRPSADQSLLLPGFKITGDRSSDADSSPAATSMVGTDRKGEATSSVYRQSFGEYESGKVISGVHAGGITGSTEAVTQALRQLKMGNLTKDFWMKDEVCKDCFLCGTAFSAWRRKHHCRRFPNRR
jgi:1-phosphatidylinositol-3-phosphate 5-kinase